MAVLMMISLQDLMSRFRNERILNMYGSFIRMRISELCIKKGVSEYMLYTLAKDLDAEDNKSRNSLLCVMEVFLFQIAWKNRGITRSFISLLL